MGRRRRIRMRSDDPSPDAELLSHDMIRQILSPEQAAVLEEEAESELAEILPESASRTGPAVLTPRPDVRVVFLYRASCSHCQQFFQTSVFDAMVRYAWAKRCRVEFVDLDTATLGPVLPFTRYDFEEGDVRAVHTPAILVERGCDRQLLEISTDIMSKIPKHFFYQFQMMIDGRIESPHLVSIMMSRAVRPPRDAPSYQPCEPGTTAAGSSTQVPQQGVMVQSDVSLRPSGSISPCIVQPRC